MNPMEVVSHAGTPAGAGGRPDRLPPGGLRPDGGQALECALRLEGVLPGRRVAVRVEAMEGDEERGSRVVVLPPHQGPEPRDVAVEGIRLYFEGDGPRALTIRADAHYVDQGGRCLL